MFAVCVTFQVAADRVDHFRELVLEQAKTSLDREPACSRFDVCADPARPQEVFLYEIYASADDFQSHLETKHFAAFDAAVRDMVVSKTVVTYSNVRA